VQIVHRKQNTHHRHVKMRGIRRESGCLSAPNLPAQIKCDRGDPEEVLGAKHHPGVSIETGVLPFPTISPVLPSPSFPPPPPRMVSPCSRRRAPYRDPPPRVASPPVHDPEPLRLTQRNSRKTPGFLFPMLSNPTAMFLDKPLLVGTPAGAVVPLTVAPQVGHTTQWPPHVLPNTTDPYIRVSSRSWFEFRKRYSRHDKSTVVIQGPSRGEGILQET
jgi:hypothetical protein